MIATSRTIRAIPTTYAGCKFRSRLEARWAVFFDRLGIVWEYEAQGHVVTDRLQICNREEWPYLPDFWLPELQMWAEVKGALDEGEMREVLSAAAHLSSNDGGGCHDAGGSDVILLGPVPRPGPLACSPLRLHMHKGDLNYSAAFGLHDDPHRMNLGTLARDSGEVYCTPAHLLRGVPGALSDNVADAYVAARSARFEHGERG